MVTDLFTVISIVISLSGSTYATIAGLRDYWHQKVHTARELADIYIGRIRSRGDLNMQANGEKKFKSVCRWHKAWRWSIAIPTLLFFISSYAITAHVICVVMRDSIATVNWWKPYIWVILLIAVADIFSIGLMVLAQKMVTYAIDDLEGWDKQLNVQTHLVPRRPGPPPALR